MAGRNKDALSPSRAKDYIQCPKLFFYKSELGIRTPPTRATLKGTIAHFAFEHIFNHPVGERDVEKAIAYIRPAFDVLLHPLRNTEEVAHEMEMRLRVAEGRLAEEHEPGSESAARLLREAREYREIVPEQEEEGFLAEVETVVRGWYGMENPEKFTPRERELYVRADVGPAVVHGYIDRFDGFTDTTGIERFFVSDYKGLDVETPVPTPSGWTRMGSLRVGDTVFASDGSLTEILEVTPRQRLRCFRLRLDDGSEIVADEVHLWPLADGDVVSTVELLERLGTGGPLELPANPLIELPEAVIPMSPRLAGRELAAAEIAHPLQDPYRTLLRVLRGSVPQRHELLLGLLEGSDSGRITLHDASLTGMVDELVLLDGFPALRWERTGRGLQADLPTGLLESRTPPPPRRLLSVEPVQSRESVCIAVDHPGHCYLAGRGLVPTHNTGKKPSPRFQDEAFFQLEVYAVALEAAEGIQTHKLRLIYTNENRPEGVLERVVTPQVMEKTRKKIKAVWQGIETSRRTGNWPTRKQRLCDWCHFKDVCPAFHPELDGLLPEEIEHRLNRPEAAG